MRILHTGDLHIGSFPGPEIRGENGRFLDCQAVIDELCQEAERLDPDFIIIAGDVFHQAKVWLDRGLLEQAVCVTMLRRLKAVAPVLVMRGTPNHDAMTHFEMLAKFFQDDKDVHIVTEPGISLYTTKAGIVQVACLPGLDNSVYPFGHNDSGENDSVFYTRALDGLVRKLGSQRVQQAPCVLTAHFTVAGANLESGQTAIFSEIEPVLTQEALQQAGFDLVCLGHVHKSQRLPGNVPVVYCGSMMQTNFNDEGQTRGFWTHEVGVSSEFHALHGREHQTLLLGDGQIGDIIDGRLDMSQWPNLKGKIVRVKYNCTDVHRKQLDQLALEKSLKQAGAYYVSEISPTKVSRTVSGLSLTEESTPETNLTDYLLEKQTDPAETQALLDLARPMFDSLDDGSQNGKHKGKLIPVEIAVKNYRNYAEERFNFDNVRFCTINGENGVGKSSLFMDAICDALYEEPREGDLAGWIRNDPAAKSGMIEFTFKLGDELFRVTRKRAKSGKTSLTLEQADGTEWKDLSLTKVKDTQSRIEQLVGMDSLTFKACALIMQNQYGLFMEADREARMDILGSILGLGEYDALEAMSGDAIVRTNRDIRGNQAKLDVVLAGTEELPVVEGQIKTMTAQRAQMAAETARLRSDRAVLAGQEKSMQDAARRVTQTMDWLDNQRRDLSAQQTLLEEQRTVIQDCQTVVGQEKEILDGYARYQVVLDDLNGQKLVRAGHDAKRRTLADMRMQLDSLSEKIEVQRMRKEAAVAELENLDNQLQQADSHRSDYEAYQAGEKKKVRLQMKVNEQRELRVAMADWSFNREKAMASLTSSMKAIETCLADAERRSALLDSCDCVDIDRARCSFLADAKAARAKIPEYQDELVSKRQELARFETETEDQRAEWDRKLDETPERELEELTAAQETLKPQADMYLVLTGKAESRKALEQAVKTAEYDLQALLLEQGTLERQTEALALEVDGFAAFEQEYGRLEAELADWSRWVDRKAELETAKTRLADATRVSGSLTEKLERVKQTISDMEASVKTDVELAQGLTDVQDKLKDVDAMLDARDEQVSRCATELGQLKARRDELEKRQAEGDGIKQEIKAQQELATRYQVLKTAFSIDGIRHNIIRSVIPVLEETATTILSQMSHGMMSVEFRTERTLKSNKNKTVTTLDIIVHDALSGSLPYASRSGGEKVKVSLSVILALAEIRSRKEGVSIGFLFIDEPPYLDGAGTQVYCDALEAVQARYSDLKIMAISHDVSMKARFPQSVTVVKTADGSHLERC